MNSIIISYMTLRRWIGILGMLLPVVLIVGGLIFGCKQVQPSISHYYYTVMSVWFTGTLCALAVFLFCYKGYDKTDRRTSALAGVFALLIALFPTDAYGDSHCGFIIADRHLSVNWIHYTSAAGLFGCFAFFCLFQFTKSTNRITVGKLARNAVYNICGLIIIMCIVLIGVINFIDVHIRCSTLILESVALLAFGLSWITKGEMILKDKK